MHALLALQQGISNASHSPVEGSQLLGGLMDGN